MASYKVNEAGAAKAKAKALIDARRYVLRSRAAEWYHKEIELAAHDLLQYLDAHRNRKGATT